MCSLFLFIQVEEPGNTIYVCGYVWILVLFIGEC
jgi:hypothetical protein